MLMILNSTTIVLEASTNEFIVENSSSLATTTSKQQDEHHEQDDEKELHFLTWVAVAYTAVLFMVAVEGVWDDHFRAGPEKTVSIKIHHDTLYKVIGWAFAGGAIMFMVWGVHFVFLWEDGRWF